MDGREVLVAIRRRYGEELAVIMISSNEQQQMVEACILAGADSYLFKPLRLADFANIWQFVMQQRCHKLHASSSPLFSSLLLSSPLFSSPLFSSLLFSSLLFCSPHLLFSSLLLSSLLFAFSLLLFSTLL